MRKLGTILLILAIPVGTALGGEIRGKVRDFQRARALTVVFFSGKSGAAQKAARDAHFRVSKVNLNEHYFRCTWTSNDAATLQRRIKQLSDSPATLLITPDPQRE